MSEKFKRKCQRKQLILITVLVMMAGFIIPILGNMGVGSEKEEAGRVLKLYEVQRIEDAQADYYLKSPRDIQIAPDGSLFVVDEDQLLKFDVNGQFIKNLYKKGQGPGELEGISDLIISDDALIILQGQPNKLMLISHDGEFIREFRPEPSVSRLCAVHDGIFVTARYGPPKLDKVGDEAKIIDQKQIVKDFGRAYRRVRFKQDDSGQVEIRPEVFRFAPPVKHLNDVQQLRSD